MWWLEFFEHKQPPASLLREGGRPARLGRLAQVIVQIVVYADGSWQR